MFVTVEIIINLFTFFNRQQPKRRHSSEDRIYFNTSIQQPIDLYQKIIAFVLMIFLYLSINLYVFLRYCFEDLTLLFLWPLKALSYLPVRLFLLWTYVYKLSHPHLDSCHNSIYCQLLNIKNLYIYNRKQRLSFKMPKIKIRPVYLSKGFNIHMNLL